MRKLLAMALVVALMIVVTVPAAYAGGSYGGGSSTATNVALGLASFAVFNQVVGGFLAPRPVYAYPAPVVIERPVPVYRQVVVVTPPPAPIYASTPTYSSVVQYPHGRYELRGDGVYTAYQWVWIPNVAVVPPPPPPPPLQ